MESRAWVRISENEVFFFFFTLESFKANSFKRTPDPISDLIDFSIFYSVIVKLSLNFKQVQELYMCQYEPS